MSMELIIGTRRSKLAMAQSELVAQVFSASGVCDASLHPMDTTGDAKQGKVGIEKDKKDWVQELEEALLESEIDIAIHSGKDVPIDLAEGTTVLPVLPRAIPYDVCVLGASLREEEYIGFEALSAGSRIGTSSLRRAAELKRFRGDLEVVTFGGNVTTRLEKLRDGHVDAIVIAGAGLERMGFHDIPRDVFSDDVMLPAVNQGILVAQFQSARGDISELLHPFLDRDCFYAWMAERAAVRTLGADCHSALGVFAQSISDELRLRVRVLSVDGSRCLESTRSAALEDAEELGTIVANELLDEGAAKLLNPVS